MLVLHGNPTCPAESPTLETLQGQTFQIQIYDCYWRSGEVPSHQFVVMSPVCPAYIAQPVLIKEAHERKGWVMNRFGEFYPSSVNIDMMEMYTPPC